MCVGEKQRVWLYNLSANLKDEKLSVPKHTGEPLVPHRPSRLNEKASKEASGRCLSAMLQGPQ